jgi:predicted RNA-binding Zn ribbon-like protein
LVRFAESERPTQALHAIASLDYERLAAGVVPRFRQMKPADVEALRAELRTFLRALAGETKHDAAMTAAITPTLYPLRVGRRVTLMVSGSPTDVTLFLAASLLEVVGTERLRLCPAPDCGRAFVKVGRVFLTTYDPFAAKPRRKDRPKRGAKNGKTTRKG